LRIFVNEELDELQSALAAAERVLKPGGRLAVVSFHSLEDRIVKNFLNARAKASAGSRHLPELAQAAPSFHLLTKRPVTAGETELAANPRARSAKLRAAERTGAAAHRAADAPSWPRLSDVKRGRLTMRLIHLLVIGALVFAAAYVYQIKMDSTARTERVLRLRAEIREQRDAIAALRSQWAKLDAPLPAAGACRASSAAEADRRHPIRLLEEPARAAAASGEARRSRSDRRDDQRHRHRDG